MTHILESAPHPEKFKRVVIEPVTRVEGHGKVTLLLDADNRIHQARFHIVEFRGFEGVEVTVRRASRRLSFALAAAGAWVAMAITADSSNVARWIPIAIGVVAGILTFGLVADAVRPTRR